MASKQAQILVPIGDQLSQGQYVIEPENLFISYTANHHRYYRLYHGDDEVRITVSIGDVYPGVVFEEKVEGYSFIFTGGTESATPYMLGSSSVMTDMTQVGDVFDLEGNIITPTFTMNAATMSLEASEPCYGMVSASVTVPYTRIGYDYKISTDIYYSKSGGTISLNSVTSGTLFAFGVESKTVLTYRIPSLHYSANYNKGDDVELWRVVSHQYITEEPTGIYEKDPTSPDPQNIITQTYDGAIMEVERTHEIGYISTSGSIVLETFHIPMGSIGVGVVNPDYPYLSIRYTGSEENLEPTMWKAAQSLLADREASKLGISNLLSSWGTYGLWYS